MRNELTNLFGGSSGVDKLEGIEAELQREFERKDKQIAAALGLTLEQWLQKKEQVKLDARAECMPQVDALMGAGWIFELPNGYQDLEPWQWYWRRPPRRKGKKGRLYLSTNQAYNAMMREQKANEKHL